MTGSWYACPSNSSCCNLTLGTWPERFEAVLVLCNHTSSKFCSFKRVVHKLANGEWTSNAVLGVLGAQARLWNRRNANFRPSKYHIEGKMRISHGSLHGSHPAESKDRSIIFRHSIPPIIQDSQVTKPRTQYDEAP